MLFERYANPFDFLDGISEMGMFEQGILQLIEDKSDCKLWELYLHSYSGQSFNDWKKSLEEQQEQKEMTDEEINTAIEKAQRALNLS